MWRRRLKHRFSRGASPPSPPLATTLEPGLATYVKCAAVWKGVLHLLSLKSLILLWVDGQIAGSLYGQSTLLGRL